MYVGFARSYEETQGAIKIATDKKIPVTIVGSTDAYTEMPLAGFLAVREEDLKRLIELANENK